MNAVMFENEIDYQKAWEELKEKDAQLPENVILTLKVDEKEKQKWVNKYTQLYSKDDLQVIHTEQPN